MKKTWIIYLALFQVTGILVSVILSTRQDDFHAFIYYLMFSLTFVNSIAVISCGPLLFFEKRIRPKLRTVIPFILFLASFGVYLSLKIVPPVIKIICNSDIIHDVDKKHIYMVLINLFISVLIISIYSMFYIYTKLKTDWERKVYEIEALKRLHIEAKLAMLQSKINPHFLFNTLNTILDLVYKIPKKAETIILNLSEIYRRILSLTDSEMIALEEEIELVKKYLDIEKIRLGARLLYEISIDKQLETVMIPPLLIQPMVENAIVHGICPKKDGGKIEIDIQKENGFIVIKVMDDGIGMSKKYKSKGFGLYSVQERLNLSYKEKAQFEIVDREKGGTEVRMKIRHEI